jgi:D-beta-D-heptose 7-phosphate kinase/D-beta-D-heptose 1-phosphate adenosyltransferase
MRERVINVLERDVPWRGKRVLIVGDICEDRWVHYRTSSRLNPESDQPILLVESDTRTFGMGQLVAGMIDALGGEGLICPGYHVKFSRKTRTWVDSRQGPRIDEDVQSLPLRLNKAWAAHLRPDMIAICDYGKGAVDRETVEVCLSFGVPVIADPARDQSWEKYCGVTAIKCNEAEFDAQVGTAYQPHLELEAMIVTLGSEGCRLETDVHWGACGSSDSVSGCMFIPQRKVENPNVIGAGDQFLAAIVLAQCSGADWLDSCKIANIAAGLKCRKSQTEPVTAEELLRALEEDRCPSA